LKLKTFGKLVSKALPKLRRKPFKVNSDVLNVDLVTSWNMCCGIAEYSRFLTTELRKEVHIRIIPISQSHVAKLRFFVLGFNAGRSNHIVHVQFAGGIFPSFKIVGHELSAFSALEFYFGLLFGNSPVITTFHELPKALAKGKIGRIYTKVLNKLISLISDLVIVHTMESAKIAQTLYGVSKQKIRIIPHGSLEKPEFHDKVACKKALGLEGKIVITIPGFVSPHKRHDLVLGLLSKLNTSCHLLIVGGTRTNEDVAFLERLRSFVAQNCLEGRVTFTGYVDDLAVIMNATDWAILPYDVITDSGILRLLIAYNVPIVASDLEAFREVYAKYGCVKLFKCGNIESLYLVLKEVLVKPEEQLRFLRENCVKAWKDTRWSVIASKHVEMYLEVLAAHPDSIYDETRQLERIEWLKRKAYGYSLEIGCATGFVVNYADVDIGLDLNKRRIRYARKRYHCKEFVLADASRLPFKDKTFDTVLIPEILEHVFFEQAKKIIQEAKRVGCHILVTLPNAGKIGYDKGLVENPEHLWFPIEQEIVDLVGDCKINYTSNKDFMLLEI